VRACVRVMRERERERESERKVRKVSDF
jgi:hypothetical protein